MTRCINLDWLEVYCLEPVTIVNGRDHYTNCGYQVAVREYGTPLYGEVLTLSESGNEVFEVRRMPYSTKEQGGVFVKGSCHIRLVNSTCYERDPIGHLRSMLINCGLTYQSVSRIDIALDFQEFDIDTYSPLTFIDAYMRGELSKVHQSNIAAHGRDYWRMRNWNSLKWGSPSSPITTKMYNKSLELREAADKPYIRTRWQECNFDPARDTWRIEFSMSSAMQTLKHKRTGAIVKQHLSAYDTRNRLLFHWHVLYEKYFDFRKVLTNKDGSLKRKYECPRVLLFRFADSVPYEPIKNAPGCKMIGRTWLILANKLEPMSRDLSLPLELRKAAATLYATFLENRQDEIMAEKARDAANIMPMVTLREPPSFDRIKDQLAAFTDKEVRLMFALARKYGYNIVDPTLPF